MNRAVVLLAIGGALAASVAWAADPPTPLAPGDTRTFSCPGFIRSSYNRDRTVFTLSCTAPTGSVTPQPTASAAPATVTATPAPATTPPPVFSPVPTALTVTPEGSPTVAPATATPVLRPVPQPGQPCPTWVHDTYQTTGPDGKPYPTWHPPVDPASGCYFGHEHGDDPSTSRANPDPPAFGYVGSLVGDAEPHAGFKVFVVGAGDVGQPGDPSSGSFTSPADVRIVFHHGTGGAGRFTTQFHSLQFDYVARDGSGREAHVAGMADTGPNAFVGTTCDSPRKGGRDIPSLACPDPYEIWNNVHLQVVRPGEDIAGDLQHVAAHVSLSSALFDPITARDPANPGSVVYAKDAFPNGADFRGCDRELYVGPVWFAASGTYRSDAYGRVDPAGPLVQRFTQGTNGGDIFKTSHNGCAPGLGLVN